MGHCSVLRMLYLTSAFDSVGHNILLNMLKVLAGFGSVLDRFSP